jgi:hypothetical protein
VGACATADRADDRPHGRLCAEDVFDSCVIACDRGNDEACLRGGEAIAQIEDRRRPLSDEPRALGMLVRSCARGATKACVAAAHASDDGNSLAPLPWLELACRGGDVASCRDAAATCIGTDEALARDAYTRLCHADPSDRSMPFTEQPTKARDEAVCVAAWSARQGAAALASAACDTGDSKGCERLGDAVDDGLAERGVVYDGCADLEAPGLGPLAGSLACEREGRAYGRACSLRGLPEHLGQLSSCAQTLRHLASQRRRFTPRAAHVGASVTATAERKSPDAIALAVQTSVPELARCFPTEAPLGSAGVGFTLDGAGRPLVFMVYGDGGRYTPCVFCTLADANLGIAGDGRAFYNVRVALSAPKPREAP